MRRRAERVPIVRAKRVGGEEPAPQCGAVPSEYRLFERSESAAKSRRRNAAPCRASTDCSSEASRRRRAGAAMRRRAERVPIVQAKRVGGEEPAPQCGAVPSEYRLFERSESAAKSRRINYGAAGATPRR